MAETNQEKATGLKFAEQQLLRHGWEKGKGLGRRENGISEAIKVQIKRDKGGMGHKEGEQFTFHWWDHVFNKASSSLVVETGQDGVMVKAENDSGNGLISNKKPRKAMLAKSMLYGSFVKSATLLSGQQHTEKTSDSDDSSSSNSEDEDQKLDLSSTTKLSDADLIKACGGRTAHKGARHGLTMSAKLARLQQQEQEFMNKYSKKNQPAATCTSGQVCKNVTVLNHEDNPAATEKTKRKKAKRKEPSENDVCDNGTATDIYESNDVEDMKKNKDTNAFVNDALMMTAEPRKKKKRNREVKTTPEESFDGHCSSASHASEKPHLKSNKTTSCLPTMKEDIPKKEKKKRLFADVISEDSTKTKPQELRETSDNVSKQKRKKKSSMDHYASSLTDSSVMMITEDSNTEKQNMDMKTGGQEKKRKKNKKKKVREIEEQEVEEKLTLEDSVPKKKKKGQKLMVVCEKKLEC
ncbi:G patch domain-containing protein 4 [Triplophysa dalaica]|uniref:G patch domain-containing protein 4 n=1 Tax=Triplophysa dalaica TaxID=1582913 RepID=UPI0024DFD1CF|nr:G patch domain-containing protein 4 [Triplophysa dalaica]XP_056617597.1 G patch domain-containing protein 4 [Triplophysa dalaica]